MIREPQSPNDSSAAHRGGIASAPGEPSVPVALLRRLSNDMCLWGLCRRRNCYRARQCRGEPQQCLLRYARLVPENARAWIKAEIDGWINRDDFDTVLEGNEDALEAMATWRAAVAHSCGEKS